MKVIEKDGCLELEEKTEEVKNAPKEDKVDKRREFVNRMIDDWEVPFQTIYHKLDYFGLSVILNEDKGLITFSDDAYEAYGLLLEHSGITISPNTLSIEIGYDELPEVLFDIEDVLSGMVC